MGYLRINDNINLNAIDTRRVVKVTWEQLWTPYDQVVIELRSAANWHQQDTYPQCTGVKLSLEELPARSVVELSARWLLAGQEVFTEATQFTTASFEIADSQWITRLDNPLVKDKDYYQPTPTPIFERTIRLDAIDRCYLDVACLGYYEATVNGIPVSAATLNSDVTDYRKRLYFETYDISELIHPGKNVIRIECGNGWGNPAPIKMIRKYNFRRVLLSASPKIAVNIEAYQGLTLIRQIRSDKRWRVGFGVCDFNNIYLGERINAQASLPQPQSVVMVPAPTQSLQPSFIPKNQVTAIHHDYQVVFQSANSVTIDFQRIITGFFSVKVTPGPTTIQMTYGENCQDGRADGTSTVPGILGEASWLGNADDPAIQRDELLKPADEAQVFQNRFAYHTFRFVTIDGTDCAHLDDIKAMSVHTAVMQRTTFETDDRTLTKLWDAGVQTRLNNMHSYFEDCARERLSYGGDDAALAEAQLNLFDVEALLTKVWWDFGLAQAGDGGIPQTAPFVGIHSNGSSDFAGSLGWQKVISTLPLVLKRYCLPEVWSPQAKQIIEKFADYLLSFSYDYIKQCCLGDWGSINTIFVDGREVPQDRECCAALMFELNLRDLKQVCLGFDNKRLANRIDRRERAVRDQILQEFYHQGVLGEGSQSAYAYALFAGLFTGKDKVAAERVWINQIEADGILSTGFWGMAMSYQLLTQLHRDDLIWQWLHRQPAPSYLSMLQTGNQTLHEYFDLHRGSSNHAMFSSYTQWMQSRLLGIRIDSFEQFHFAPYLGHRVAHLTGEVRGFAKVQIEYRDGEFEIQLQLNPNKHCEVDLKNFDQQGFKVAKQSRKDNYLQLLLEEKA